MLTLICGVMAYLNYKDLAEANAKLNQAESNARTSDAAVRKLDEELQALKKLIGNEQDEIGLDNKTPNTVIGATEQDIKTHADVLAEPTIKNTLIKLSTQLNQTKNQLAQEQADKNKLEAQFLALKGELDKVVDQHRTARDGAEKDLADTQKVKEEEVSAKDQQIAALTEAYVVFLAQSAVVCVSQLIVCQKHKSTTVFDKLQSVSPSWMVQANQFDLSSTNATASRRRSGKVEPGFHRAKGNGEIRCPHLMFEVSSQ